MKCLLCGDRTFLDEEGFCSFKCEGAYEERQRIIKLLEAEQAKAGQSLDADAEFYTGLKLAIALIKGEK